MTPVIAWACVTREVQDYFARPTALQGRDVAPQELLQPFAAHYRFKWAYPFAGTGIYLSLPESETSSDAGRVAEAEVHCDGPNMGSAGGPSLQSLGAVARLRYEGPLGIKPGIKQTPKPPHLRPDWAN
jgi:hypothetical protein